MKSTTAAKVRSLARFLADPYTWNWMRTASERDAADKILHKMAELGLIKHTQHPLGGDIWRAGNQIFGRTESLPKRFRKYTTNDA